MATALELGPKGWKKYRPRPEKISLHSGVASVQDDVTDELFKRAKEIGRILKNQLGARRVILLGSLMHLGWFGPESDVDFAVQGLEWKEFCKAWRIAEDLIGDRPVDLIDLDTVGESMMRAIERYGEEL